jgi:hypothetical protein
MLVVAIASISRFFITEQQRTLEREAATAYESLTWTLTTSLADLRASQQAYVAAGQDLDIWIESTEQAFENIAVGLARLQELSRTPGALEALGDTLATVDRLRRVDEIAREHALEGQALMASDLVFSDGRDLARRAGSHLELARSLEREATALQQDSQRRTQVASVTMMCVVALLVAMLLFPAAATKAPLLGEESDASAFEPEPALDVVLAHPGSNPVQSPPEVAVTTAAPSDSEPESIVPDLRQAAEVCTDLGRLSDGTELTSVLARAAQVLNASGLVLWVRDETGTGLRAATGYGYTANQLSRLGRVSCESDNATAAAYRTAQLQTVPSEADLPGAMAVPLLAASPETSSVGVFSVEVAPGWETSEAVQATALILAAQLATFVTADPLQAQASRGSEDEEDEEDEDGVDQTAHAVG